MATNDIDQKTLSDDDAIDVLIGGYMHPDSWLNAASGMRGLHRDKMLTALRMLSRFADSRRDHHAARAIDRYVKAHCESFGIEEYWVKGLGKVRRYLESKIEEN